MKRKLIIATILSGSLALSSCAPNEKAYVEAHITNPLGIIAYGGPLTNLGNLTAPPVTPNVNDVYYDTGLRESRWYTVNGTWQTVAVSGAAGAPGVNGTNGTPGAPGAPGPNSVTSATATDKTGILTGNGSYVNSITDNSMNWNTAYGWGNHSAAGYLTSYTPPTANLTTSGIVELATGVETTAGTDATRAVTPDGLAGSAYGQRIVEIKLIDDATALAANAGNASFCIPAALNGYNLVDAQAFVTTQSTSGTPTYQVINVTNSVNTLSTAITIDANNNELTSYTAATPPVIDTAHDDVATGDIIKISKTVAGTGEKGDSLILTFQLP